MSQALYAHFRCRPELASEAFDDVAAAAAALSLDGAPVPSNVDELVDYLRLERYVDAHERRPFEANGLVHRMYYAVRPLLRTSIRSKLQQFAFRDWKSIPFPSWPVDTSVENIFANSLKRRIEGGPAREEPFVWFWPQGATAALMMTHDVETEIGLNFLPELLDLDQKYGVPASIQLVPEERYVVTSRMLQMIEQRGFEVCVQDLNHDGHLFDSEAVFRQRAELINDYGRRWRAKGFRAGALYRNAAWCDAFDFQYDMSVPNLGHLEAQRGGCCTVFPYFIGGLLELPLTTTQDYSLFNILNTFSIELWMQQINRILEQSGLISFIVHPDYIVSKREQCVYRELLAAIRQLRNSQGVWVALPNDINRWWRERAKSHVVREGDSWKITGPASGRATLAYATIDAGRLVYRIEGESKPRALLERSVAISAAKFPTTLG